MARHGENIRKRKDGRWEGRFLIYDEEKGRKIYRSIYAQTYEEVRKRLTEQKNSLTTIVLGTENSMYLYNIKFSDVAEKWLEEIKNNNKPSTYIKYNAIYCNHIRPDFKDVVLSDITDTFVDRKISTHLSDSICKSTYCVLNQILKFASKNYSLSVPVLKKTTSSIRNKAVKTFTQNEQKKLIAVLCRKMDPFKEAVLICLFTGLRLGELCALKWSDIDLENGVLTVNRTVQRIYTEENKKMTMLVETTPKSECSRREIPLSDAIRKLLYHSGNDKEYVFGGDRPLEPRTLQYQFKKILRDAGLPDKNFHSLRHTFSTNCIEGGTDVKSLSEILGHSDVQITLNRYVHPSMDTKRQYMEGLSTFYSQISGQGNQNMPDFSDIRSVFVD